MIKYQKNNFALDNLSKDLLVHFNNLIRDRNGNFNFRCFGNVRFYVNENSHMKGFESLRDSKRYEITI